MKVDPEDYAWLRDSAYAQAGCVTVVARPEADRVRAAFGCSEEPLSNAAAETRQPDATESALVAAVAGGLLVLEDNGFQGARPEVLRPASRAGDTGKAASIFWNVNDEIQFTCARKGKVLCSFELGEDESDIDGLPAGLRPLVRMCVDGDVDLVAVGAAMVENYTGVRFGPEALETASLYELTPVPSDLEADSAQFSPLTDSDANLHAAVVALPAGVQRQLAEWVTRTAVYEAGLDDDPAVGSVTAQFGGGAVRLTPAAEAVVTRWERVQEKLSTREMLDGEEASGRVETSFASQRQWAGEALRYVSHSDPLTAALRCVHASLFVFSCSRAERPLVFTEDHRGRWSESAPGPVGREPQFRDVLARVLTTDPAEWGVLRAELPAPLTNGERDELVRRDREREEQGDFDTWQYG